MALGSKGASCKSIPDSGDTRNLSNVDKLYRPNPWVSEWIWESTRKQNGRKQLRATAFAPSRSIWPTAQVVGDLLMVFPRPAPEWTQSQFWWTLFQHAGSTSCIDLATALVMSWNWLGRFHDKHGFWLFFKCRYSDNTWKLFLTLKTHEIALLSVVHYQYTIQNNPDMKCCDFDFRPIKHQKCSKHPFLNGTLIVRKQQKKTTPLCWFETPEPKKQSSRVLNATIGLNPVGGLTFPSEHHWRMADFFPASESEDRPVDHSGFVKHLESHLSHEKKSPYYIPSYWMFNRDPSNGLF